MPETKINVFGGFPGSAGIHNIAAALQAGFPDADVRVYNFGEELGPTLHFRMGPIFFATLFMDDEDVFLFDGDIPGPLEEAVCVVQQISDCLAAAKLEYDFHVDCGTMEYAASFVYPLE